MQTYLGDRLQTFYFQSRAVSQPVHAGTSNEEHAGASWDGRHPPLLGFVFQLTGGSQDGNENVFDAVFNICPFPKGRRSNNRKQLL